MYKILKVLLIVFLTFISFLAILTIDAIGENVLVDLQIKSFIEKGEYSHQVGDFFFYEVPIEEELRTPSITYRNNGYPETTTEGDIFIYRESEIDLVQFSGEFISFFFGGHAGIIDGDSVIEAFGVSTNPEYNIVDYDINDIFYDYSERDVLGLRVRASDEDVEKAMTFSRESVGKYYNMSFVFNRKDSFYCTDLISRAYSKEAGLSYNLDKDGIATSCNDLVLSNDTFITYYMYYLNNERHLYYAVNK